MIWAGLICAASAVALASVSVRDAKAATAAVACVAGVAVMQLFKAHLPEQFLWLGAGAVWIAASAAMVRHLPVVAALLTLSGLCYFYGRVTGQTFISGSPALFWADVFGVAAMALIGWRVGRIYLRNWRMGGVDSGSFGRADVRCHPLFVEAVSQPQVRLHVGR